MIKEVEEAFPKLDLHREIVNWFPMKIAAQFNIGKKFSINNDGYLNSCI